MVRPPEHAAAVFLVLLAVSAAPPLQPPGRRPTLVLPHRPVVPLLPVVGGDSVDSVLLPSLLYLPAPARP